MARGKIMVVEDDDDIRDLIAYNLKKEGYSVYGCSSGEAALNRLKKDRPDIILLDLMLPEMDGLEVCRRLKMNEQTAGVPVIMVTAKGEESDVVAGLELGADDYVTKPFKPKELTARVRAALRRTVRKPEPVSRTISVGNIVMDPARREARVSGKVIDLTFTEFEILHVLALHPGRVFTRYQIVDAVRGEGYAVTDRSVDVQIVGLRKKLGNSGGLVETVRGVGYRLKDD